MIVLTDPQGSTAWLRARFGLPTASNFDKIITKTGKPSASADRYLARLLAEWWLDESIDDAASGFMDRGTVLEDEAVPAYEFAYDVTTTEVGLCLSDDRRFGASPDRLVGEHGGLEVKCPSADVHMMYLLDGPPSDYFCQVQGCLWVTGREWWNLYCWHPTFPAVVKRYDRDEEFIKALAEQAYKLSERLEAAKAKYADQRAAYLASKPTVDYSVPAELST